MIKNIIIYVVDKPALAAVVFVFVAFIISGILARWMEWNEE